MENIETLFEDQLEDLELEEDIVDDIIIPKEAVIVKVNGKTKIMHVSNAELLKELETSRNKGVMTERLGEMFIKLASHYLNRYEWRNYTYKDEMQSLCLVYMCQCWNKFNPEKTTQAFSYFTQVCYSACLRHLAYEKKASRVKDNLYGNYNLTMQTNFINHYDKSSVKSSDDVVYKYDEQE